MAVRKLNRLQAQEAPAPRLREIVLSEEGYQALRRRQKEGERWWRGARVRKR